MSSTVITTTKTEESVKGYYLVKFYNHQQRKLMFFNGLSFEHFPSEECIHDEIESWERVKISATCENDNALEKSFPGFKESIDILDKL